MNSSASSRACLARARASAAAWSFAARSSRAAFAFASSSANSSFACLPSVTEACLLRLACSSARDDLRELGAVLVQAAPAARRAAPGATSRSCSCWSLRTAASGSAGSGFSSASSRLTSASASSTCLTFSRIAGEFAQSRVERGLLRLVFAQRLLEVVALLARLLERVLGLAAVVGPLARGPS